MRVAGENWSSGEQWFARSGEADGGGRFFTALGGSSLGSTTHLSSCGCAGCIEKMQIPDNSSPPDDNIARTGGDDDIESDEVSGADTVGGTTGTASTLAIGASTNGWVNTAGDDDWYAVTLVAGQSYTFSLVGGTLVDPYLEIRNSAGTLIGFDDDFGAGLNSSLRWTATSTGVYYINARAWEADTGATLTGNYTLTAATSAPASPLDSIDYQYTMPTTSISVWFATPGYTNPSNDPVSRAWTQNEINAVMAALGTYSAITPLTFSIAPSQNGATWIFSLALLEGNTLGYFAVGGQYAAFDPTVSGFTAGLTPGGNSWITVIHEAGHGLGMAHPHDQGAIGTNASEFMQGVLSPFGSYGTFELNQGLYTTMTYNDSGQATPMALDVALMQQRYGVNPNTGAGNTTYTISLASPGYRSIWDVSGIDNLSYSGSSNATIDLRAATLLNAIGGGGYLSFVPGVSGGFTIANGVIIENATSGNGDDTLTGNSADNTLDSGFGSDTLSGNGGNDRLVSGDGFDLINGGAGVDTSVYTVDSTSTTWVRDPSGSWTVGGDTLNSVEFLDFSDRDVFLDRAFRTFSGNGSSDVLFRRDDGIMASWEVTGTTINSASFLPTAGAEWTPRATGDVSGDGRDDVIWQRNDGLVYAWLMNGGAVSSAVALTGIGAEWTFLGMGDFNGDLTDDFAWQRNDGLVYTWTMANAAIQSANAITGLGAEWAIEGFGDFNSDGRDDFVWRNTSGQTVIWQMNGSSIQSSGFTSTQVGLEWSIVGVGDTNGDGRDDIVLQRASDGMLAVWAMDGTSVLSAANIGAASPAEWTVSGVGDYNGDGRDDILWQNDNGLVYTWLLNGSTIIGAGGLSGVGAEWTIVGGG